jgi:hypothetical protein
MPKSTVDLDNRLHAVWEKTVTFELALYDTNVSWAENLPVTASDILKKMADDLVNAASELSSIACDLEAESKAENQRMQAAGAAIAEGIAAIERDTLTSRFAEIVKKPVART